MHTKYSDGILEPAELIDLAKKNNVEIMSINDLKQLNAIDENSEEDEEMYIPIPFRFHDLAQRGDAALLEEEIQKNNNRDYNPHVDLAIVVMR